MRLDKVILLIRYPRFRFRPSHADALHLDLWINEKNLLNDAGSYSYNTNDFWLKYFPGTESHNTIQFDNRDQMPRISRFLFGPWLKTKIRTDFFKNNNRESISIGYKDLYGCCHTRTVSLSKKILFIKDKIAGFKKNAVLRWRLNPDKWTIKRDIVFNQDKNVKIKIKSDMKIKKISIMKGWQSKFYHSKIEIPVLEIKVTEPGNLYTEISWNL